MAYNYVTYEFSSLIIKIDLSTVRNWLKFCSLIIMDISLCINK